MGKCDICGANGNLLRMNHEELGRVMICRDCWEENHKNQVISCSGEGSGGGGPLC